MEGLDKTKGLPMYYERNDVLVIEAFRRVLAVMEKIPNMAMVVPRGIGREIVIHGSNFFGPPELVPPFSLLR